MKNTKMPAIRFKGFNDDWEQRKLGELYQRNTERNENLIGYDKTISVATMSYKDDGNGASESSLSTYKVLRVGDIAFEGHTNKQFRFGRFVVNDIGTGIMSPRFSTLRPLNEMPVNFWKQYIHSESVMRRILVNSTKAGTMMNELVIPKFLNQTIMVPSENEQAVIGQYFSNLDHLITLHQRKLEKIKLMKKSMLGKMFSRDAESIPKIRFDGYTDDWEQRKLGDVIEKLTGGASIAPDDYVDVGYRTIPKGAVNSSGVADMSGCKNVSENFFKKNISSKTSSGELVTSLRDLVPTAPNMGRIVRICGETEDFLMPQGVYSIIVKEKISEDFLITYSNSPEYRKIIMAEKNGSTQVHIRNGEFLNIDIPLPSYEEQMKIGEHFKTLNHLITLHQRKLEKLKKVKKSLLEHMFPMEK